MKSFDVGPVSVNVDSDLSVVRHNEIDRAILEFAKESQYFLDLEEKYKDSYIYGVTKSLLFSAVNEILMLKKTVGRLQAELADQKNLCEVS